MRHNGWGCFKRRTVSYYLLAVYSLGIPACVGAGGPVRKAQQAAPQGEDAQAAKDFGEPKVQRAWQEAFRRYVEEEAADGAEAWAVVSYSGWMDFGQHMFMHSPAGKAAYWQVPENFAHASASKPELSAYLPQRGADGQWSLAANQWQHFARPEPSPWGEWEQSLRAFAPLEPLARTVMDGMEVEYLWLKKQHGKVEVLKRLYINTPDEQHGAAHLKAITDFREMVNKSK